MGARGTAPRPLELVKALGNPGHIAHLDRPRAHFVPTVPECPDYIDEVGRAEWERLSPQLIRLGLLTSADYAAFACYCVSYSMLVAASLALADGNGLTFSSGDNGYVQARPEIAIRNNAMKSIKDFAIQFGFTPSARGRIELPEPPGGNDEDLD
jgi:P27 family predicted phage terminase small subunit